MIGVPVVPLRSTSGYDPMPLRGFAEATSRWEQDRSSLPLFRIKKRVLFPEARNEPVCARHDRKDATQFRIHNRNRIGIRSLHFGCTSLDAQPSAGFQHLMRRRCLRMLCPCSRWSKSRLRRSDCLSRKRKNCWFFWRRPCARIARERFFPRESSQKRKLRDGSPRMKRICAGSWPGSEGFPRHHLQPAGHDARHVC